MNILVLTNEYPYDKYPRANWTKVVAYFAKEWVKMGHKVVAIVNTSTFPKAYYMAVGITMKLFHSNRFVGTGLSDTSWTHEFSFSDQGVEVINLPMVKYSAGGKYTDIALRRQVARIISELNKISFKPDVITGHWLNPQLYLVGELKKYYSVKGTCVFHGDYSRERCEKFHAKELMKKVDHIGFRSASALKTASEYLTFPVQPFICYSGVPDKFIELNRTVKERKFSNNCIKLISAGRLVPYKCFDTTINAVSSALENKTFIFEIAGEGPEHTKLQTIIDNRHEADRIKLIGKIPREELQEKIKKSDVFVLISKKETFGLVYLEAMLQGCIVIASRFGGVDGIVNDGVNGFLCEENNGEELMSIINRICDMSLADKQRMSLEAVHTAQEFTDSKVASKYLNELLS